MPSDRQDAILAAIEDFKRDIRDDIRDVQKAQQEMLVMVTRHDNEIANLRSGPRSARENINLALMFASIVVVGACSGVSLLVQIAGHLSLH